eukprot:6214807-Pleurochrysis_carterae.AAC.7
MCCKFRRPAVWSRRACPHELTKPMRANACFGLPKSCTDQLSVNACPFVEGAAHRLRCLMRMRLQASRHRHFLARLDERAPRSKHSQNCARSRSCKRRGPAQSNGREGRLLSGGK